MAVTGRSRGRTRLADEEPGCVAGERCPALRILLTDRGMQICIEALDVASAQTRDYDRISCGSRTWVTLGASGCRIRQSIASTASWPICRA